MGEQRGFLSRGSMLIDDTMELEEAEYMLGELRNEMPLWQFWLVEQEFVDEEVQQGVRTQPELSV
jgi:hypothetical protein